MITEEEQARQKLFETRKSSFLETKNLFQKKFNLLSTFRILFFIIGVIALVYFANRREVLAVEVLVFLIPILFGFFLNYHHKIKYQLNQAIFLSEINQNEIKRINLALSDFDNGNEFQSPIHPYCSDLNFFGKHSLFQLINRTVTREGRILLAETLKKPLLSTEEIIKRQAAVKELKDKLEWRQEFEATGKHEKDIHVSYNYLLKWIKEPSALKNLNLLRWVSFLSPIALIVSTVCYFAIKSPGYLVIVAIIINILILGAIAKTVKTALEKTDKTSALLKTYSALISSIEQESFHSELLISLKGKVASKEKKASARIKELSKIVGNLELRNNPYFSSTINIALLWDLHWLIKLEEWKAGLKDEVEEWLLAVEEFEVLNSLAGFAFLSTDLIFPDIKQSDFYISGTHINHPLIARSKRVDNGIVLEGLGKTHVITGSNMSGKSTYMRTMGTNAVLALIGAPVLAHSFEISPMEVFTCMHIHDSLEEETSSFYAELKRIKQLITGLQSAKPVLYLLDELLKGTNSVDRNLGAKALIRQLHHKTASGLISTHDLELGEMEVALPGFVKNFSFNSSIIDNEIIFDYKLTDGICRSFNASKLMEKMGIEIKEQITTPN